MITRATVNIWGERAGALEWNESARIGIFRFDPKFLSRNLELSPFMMPVNEARNTSFRFPELIRSQTFKGLPGMIADVLPDKYGNALITSWLTRNGRSPESINPVERLCFISSRGMGALEFEPETYPSNRHATQLEIKDLLAITDQILAGKKDLSARLTDQEEQNIMDVLKVGTSAGGARAKAIIAYNEQTGEIRTGQTAAGEGFEHWLIKFDGILDGQLGVSSGYGKVEMAYYLMATDAGIKMNECRLINENGRSHFMTKRFDRRGSDEKIHMQSFCALRHFDFNEVGYYGYEQLFETMRRLKLPYADHDQLFRRMVFNVLARNCDDHTKNFSFLLDQDGSWYQSPAYDMCHAYRPKSEWVQSHSMTINGKRNNITREDMIMVARNCDIKKADTIIDDVANAVANWEEYAGKVNVSERLKEAIEATLLPGFDEYRNDNGNRTNLKM